MNKKQKIVKLHAKTGGKDERWKVTISQREKSGKRKTEENYLKHKKSLINLTGISLSLLLLLLSNCRRERLLTVNRTENLLQPPFNRLLIIQRTLNNRLLETFINGHRLERHRRKGTFSTTYIISTTLHRIRRARANVGEASLLGGHSIAT